MRSRIKGKMLCIKYLMLTFNLLFWLSGVALVVIGGLGEILYGDYKSITQTGFTSATAILMAIGCVITVLGFAGCYGAIRDNYYALKVFSYTLVFLLVVEIALGLWVYLAHFSVAKLLPQFLNQILSKYQDDKDIQDLTDRIQREYNCCGSNGYKDWFNSDWNTHRQNNSVPFWVNNVPRSCCLPNTTQLPTCGDDLDTADKPAHEYVYTKGCLRTREFFSKHLFFMTALGFAVVLIHVLAILFTCCLRRAIKYAYGMNKGDRIHMTLA